MNRDCVARLNQEGATHQKQKSLKVRIADRGVHIDSGGLPIGPVIEGFLFAAHSSWSKSEAVDLLRSHLGAEVLNWEPNCEVKGFAPSVPSQGLLFIADFRKLMTLEDLSRFESAVQDFAESCSKLKVYKLLLVDPIAYHRLSQAAQSLGYPPRNQFCVTVQLERLWIDPDGEFHRAISQVARSEGRQVSLVTEEMTCLLETTGWRFGGLELDLFLRECIRRMGTSPILTADYLPGWFKALPERNPGVLDSRIAQALESLGIPIRKKNQIS